MGAILVSTLDRCIPMIYAYSTPGVSYHDGWVKIGYTGKQTVDERIRQQTHTAGIMAKEEWRGNAFFEDGSGDSFHDTDFHLYLRRLGVENDKGTELYHIDGKTSRERFNEFRCNRGIINSCAVTPYILRDEQERAVAQTVDYLKSGKGKEFLWNAKPRFGKTLAVYDFMKRIGAISVLILTNRPAIANSWYNDYEKFIGTEDGYRFISTTDALKEKKLVLTREQFIDVAKNEDEPKMIEFVSLQDLKGSVYFGGNHEKLETLSDIRWDLVVIDEAHEGVDTVKTELALDRIKRRFTLHLSGTPFKALAGDKFAQDAIFNWTYADEQRAKSEWIGESFNPYEELPRLNMFTYQMSEIVADELKQGIDIDGETREYAFDLNVFFAVNSSGNFVHDGSVDKFLNALTKQSKFPFSTPELRDELKHTLWLLNHVDSVKALAKKLKEHTVFKEYEIVVAAGDGKLSEDEETKKSYDKVVEAISTHDRTITLSVGQLTTGVTIPEWTGVLMLSNMKSPAQYVQAAFRAQNPYSFNVGVNHFYKKNAYVFDFDPARTLTVYDKFANDLTTDKVTVEEREENIKTLLNFFPVIGEDEGGEMVELDAEKVLTIPRKIHSQEVVRRGFISNLLFADISNIFHAPDAIKETINKLTQIKEQPKQLDIPTDKAKSLNLNDKGEVDVPNEVVIGKNKDIFGDKVYGDDTTNLAAEAKQRVDEIKPSDDSKKVKSEIEKLKNDVKENVVKGLVDVASKEYGTKVTKSVAKKVGNKLNNDTERMLNRDYDNYCIDMKRLERDYKRELEVCETPKQREQADEKFGELKLNSLKKFQESLHNTVDTILLSGSMEMTKTLETISKNREKDEIENEVREHLNGFTRTIPSFLMAYGNENLKLKEFETVIPPSVFKEVTGITIQEFVFLRDGGQYTNSEGNPQIFPGGMFDEIVFNDSVREFFRKKKELANYFEPSLTEDIFDYIPPQRTNQIFTPKWVVKNMADMLEAENPGCFDMPDKTFADLYMKSGMYIAEIVKRLYRSERMCELYPNGTARLEHIFEHQVYGLAPTEIIYQIAVNYILGFVEDGVRFKHNFKQGDIMKHTDDVEKWLDELYK